MAERWSCSTARGGNQLGTMRGEEACAGELHRSLVGKEEAVAFEVGFQPNGPNSPGGGHLSHFGV